MTGRELPKGGVMYLVLQSFKPDVGHQTISTVNGIKPDGWLPIFMDRDEAEALAQGVQILEVYVA